VEKGQLVQHASPFKADKSVRIHLLKGWNMRCMR